MFQETREYHQIYSLYSIVISGHKIELSSNQKVRNWRTYLDFQKQNPLSSRDRVGQQIFGQFFGRIFRTENFLAECQFSPVFQNG